MKLNNKKIAINTIIIFIFVSIITLAASLYPYAQVTFSGIEMVTNGSTTQGFVDITLKNVDTTGISFCLKYDTDHIVLSDANTNVAIQNPTSTGLMGNSFNIQHKYFEQNTEAFPEGTFKDSQLPGMIGVYMPIVGIADAESGHLIMNFLPKEEAVASSDYVEMVEKDNIEYPTIMANGVTDGLKLGRLSFQIKDPAKFSKLSEEEVANLIKVVKFSDMMSIEDSEVQDDTGIHMSYLDDEGTIRWYSHETHHIDYTIQISAKVKDVTPDVEKLTVSSYEIYKTGKKQDLLDYINEKASKLTLSYADGSQVPVMFEWSADSVETITWDPKGGEDPKGVYKITQQYNEEFDVSVTVHVTPVTLIDFDTAGDDITYLYGSEDFPETFEELELPKKTRPVLDTYLPNGGIPELDIEWYNLEGVPEEIEDLPADFDSGDPGTFTFIGHLSAEDEALATNYPWLTAPYPLPEIKVNRHVVTDQEDMPKKLVVNSAVTDADGKLTIVVKNSDDSAIPDETVFDIRMPGGETISPDIYTVTITDGVATIVIDPDIEIAEQKKTAQVINLGNRAGDFAIASTEPDKHKGEFTEFSPEPRRNLYLSDYEFDYSSLLSAMFPVKAGTTLPTTVTLPVSSDRIGTTYSGYDGTEIGQLATFTVDSWEVLEGDITAAGSVVKVRGTLLDTDYTNYGEVFNDNGYTVTIKYLVVENDGTDSIEAIPDFEYNTQQVGYDYDRLQTETFTVKNNGLTDIYGLSAVISVSEVADETEDETKGKEAFVMTKELPQILASGKSAELDITTKIGLPIGKYVSTVSIMSNNKVLETFKITFEVSEKPQYRIIIEVNDSELGSAYTGDGLIEATAEEGAIITIIAKPKEDCKFVNWTVTEGSVVFDDEESETTTFVMPAEDVKIKANFAETLGAKLKATELYVKDADDETDPATGDSASGFKLHDKNWTQVKFDPVTREYYVAVPNDVNEVKLWFNLEEYAQDATIGLKNEKFDKDGNKVETVIDPPVETTDPYYKTYKIELEESPTENLVTLSLTKEDSVNHPDEGMVTKSYKIHIYRKIAQSELMKFNYGNSPYGLIMRDDTTFPTETAKDTAWDEFTKNGNTFTAGYTPVGATPGTVYLDKAWNGANYDFNDSALFVINTSSFTDPGYKSVTNSIGGEVTSVSKSIEVNTLTENNSSLQNGSSDDFVYISSEEVNLPASGEIKELNGKRIRPDVYELKYNFKDFDGSDVYISKPLIILSPLGDVNVSTAADTEDVSRILHRFSTDIADSYNVPEYTVGGALFKFRVCDVNKDGNLNAVDANNIRANKIVPFYTNLSEGGDG